METPTTAAGRRAYAILWRLADGRWQVLDMASANVAVCATEAAARERAADLGYVVLRAYG